MKEYVYMLSNPSMPGLVKIGKTTTSPSQRMTELHTTGVPTPFELEFAAEVENCHSCERDVHGALAQYRLSSKREFFEVPVREAIKKILPVLGDYQLISVKESHGIAKIEADLRGQAEKKEAAHRQRNAEIDREKRELLHQKSKKVAELQGELAKVRQQLSALGSKPEYKTEPIENFLILCWLPIPLGWLVWLGTLQVLSATYEWVGIVCLFLLVGGFLVYSRDKENQAAHLKMTKPFSLLEEEITRLEKAIKEEGATPRPPSPTSTPRTTSQPHEKVIVSCPACTQKMRLPANMTLDTSCPHCKNLFRIKT